MRIRDIIGILGFIIVLGLLIYIGFLIHYIAGLFMVGLSLMALSAFLDDL